MEGRITTQYEASPDDDGRQHEHIESTTVNGQAMVKIFLQPHARLDTANAQVTAVSQTILRQLPPGISAALIINYSASTVPILHSPCGTLRVGTQRHGPSTSSGPNS